jgi:hypothetical protein
LVSSNFSGRYQRGNQNLLIEEEQTTRWPKEKGQKDKLYKSENDFIFQYVFKTMVT